MKRLAVALLVLICSVAPAQDALSTAVKRITNTGVFAFGGVGLIGKTSQGELDFRVIQSQPAPVALASFEKIYATGDAAAKSYALAGIRQLDETRFKELFQSLEGSQETVFTMQGCIMERHRLGEIAKAIDAGSYDSWLKPRT
ncbi:MAG TPA: hypothetical protein VGG45_07530 [Terracidiphilus sp.]